MYVQIVSVPYIIIINKQILLQPGKAREFNYYEGHKATQPAPNYYRKGMCSVVSFSYFINCKYLKSNMYMTCTSLQIIFLSKPVICPARGKILTWQEPILFGQNMFFHHLFTCTSTGIVVQ